jgi:hypothetical protein
MIKTRKIALAAACLAVFMICGTQALAQNAKGAAAPATSGTIPIQHYAVDLNYDGSAGAAQIKSINLVNGAANGGLEPTGGWRYDVVTAQGEIINHRFIAVPVDCSSANAADPKAKVTCTEKDQFDLPLEIPFDASAKNINIYDPSGKMVAFVDVSEFSQICGDGVCGGQENFKTCPQDCRSGIKDGYCDGATDGVCDPDCTTATDHDCAKIAALKTTQKTGGGGALWIVILAIIVIIVAVAAVIIKKKKGQASDSDSAQEPSGPTPINK